MKDLSRIIGVYETGNKGNLLFITAGIHGNEPAGVLALQRVFKILAKEKPNIKGKVVAVSGNLKALRKDVRFIDEDLNRTWTEDNIRSKIKNSHEKKEMFDIISVLNRYPKRKFKRRYFLDCHTTSSKTEPYISVQNINDNLAWAQHFPTYIICGFSDIVEGCIDHYESRIGITGFVFEAGQHEDEKSIQHQEGMIWLTLQKACELDFDTMDYEFQHAKDLNQQRSFKKTFEIIYRHGIESGNDFVMRPGFENFQKIEKGELLARENEELIYSKWDAHIFMPLYQKQGDDGFFILKKVSK